MSFAIPSFKGNIAHATAPDPSWWLDDELNFSQYDDYQYMNGRYHDPGTGTQLYPGSITLNPPGTNPYILSGIAFYDGVAAIGPRPFLDEKYDVDVFFTPYVEASQEEEWECAELVKRFLYLEYGTNSIPANGSQIVYNYTHTATGGYPDVFKSVVNDGSAKVYPKPGDVLSYGSYANNGHTALVQSVTDQSNGSATVRLIEQNASDTGITYQDFNNWQFQNGIDNDPNNTDTVTGWLTPKYNWSRNNPPNPTNATTLQITGMSATSTNDVWAVGYYYKPGTNKWTGYAAHNDGTGWTEYDTPRPNNQADYYNMGITNTNNGVFAVGYTDYYGGLPYSTIAFKWNSGTQTWSQVSTDNPYTGPNGNQLTAVSSDSNGNMWAVGVGHDNSGNWPHGLIQQWNGSAFVEITNSQLASEKGQFNAVAVSSSSNAWAVGNVWDTGTNRNYGYVYHYANGSWTKDTNPNITSASYANVKGVAIISDSEIWITGTIHAGYSDQAGFVEHYVNSAWSNYSSLPGPAFNAIVANYSSDVWVAGTDYVGQGCGGGCALIAPFTYHWNGSTWTYSFLSRDDSADIINTIAGTGYSGYLFMGGYHAYNSNNITKYPEVMVYR